MYRLGPVHTSHHHHGLGVPNWQASLQASLTGQEPSKSVNLRLIGCVSRLGTIHDGV